MGEFIVYTLAAVFVVIGFVYSTKRLLFGIGSTREDAITDMKYQAMDVSNWKEKEE